MIGFLPRRSISQPTQAPQIDRANPLTVGLSMLQVMGAYKQYDAVRGMNSAVIGTKNAPNVRGLATGFGATVGAGSTDRVATPLVGALSKRSYFFKGMRNGSGGGSLGRLFDKTSGSSGQFLYWSGGTSFLTYGFYLGGTEQIVQILDTINTVAVGRVFDVVVTHDVSGTTHTINAYINGAPTLVNYVVVGTLTDAAATVLTIGNRASDGVRCWDGSIAIGATWERILAPAEADALSANQWQLTRSLPTMYAPDAVSGGGSYTLTCATGSYSLSGVNAALAAAHRVAAAQGAYVITGQPTGVTAAHRMVAAPGAYSIAGNAAGLVYVPPGVVLPAAGGSYAITGNAVTMRAAHRLVAQAGSYAITGNAVATPGEELPASGGSGGGSVRDVRNFADLLDKARPTKTAKKRLRRVLEAEALELLPDVPQAAKAASIIAQVVAKKEIQAIERRPVDAAPLAALPFDPSEEIARMVAEWLENDAIQRELEDEYEVELLLMG